MSSCCSEKPSTRSAVSTRSASRGGAAAASAGRSPPSRAPSLSTAESPSLGLLHQAHAHNIPVECAAEPCGVTHKTAFEWRHRVLATVSGYQDRIALRDTVWVDEIHINDTDLSKGYGRARKRGLSRQKPCICVAIDSKRTRSRSSAATASPARRA